VNGFGRNVYDELTTNTIHHCDVQISATAIKKNSGDFVIRSLEGHRIQIDVTGNGIYTNGSLGHQFGEVTHGVEHGLLVELLIGCKAYILLFNIDHSII